MSSSSSSSSSVQYITSGDLEFFLSGGPTNSDPSRSLGGLPSGTRVSPGPNGLFSNLSEVNLRSGTTDYRCVYLSNKSQAGFLYGLSLHIESESTGGSLLEIGVNKSTESQVISIQGPVFFGVVEFSFDGEEVSANWSSSAESFRQSLESSLSSIGLDVQVSYSYPGSSHKFLVEFLGSSANRKQPMLQLTNNLMVGLSNPEVSVERQTEGSPINSIAPETATPEVSPFGVEFQPTSPSSKIVIGILGPGEHMPFWIRRQTPAGSPQKEDSGLVIRVSGSTTPI